MEHKNILKRAWHIVKTYRALWVIGFLLALTTAGYGRNTSPVWQYNSDDEINVPAITLERVGDEGFKWELSADAKKDLRDIERAFNTTVPRGIRESLPAILVSFTCLLLLLIVVSVVVSYITETSAIRMVDHYENTDEQLSFRAGWKLGASRYAWRFFFTDFFVVLLVIVAVLVMVVIAGLPALLWFAGTAAGIVGTIISVGLLLLVVFFMVLASIVLHMVVVFARRAIAIDNMGIGQALGYGYAMLRKNLNDVGLMWLVVAGVNVGWAVFLFLVIIIALIVGALIGGIPGLIVYGILTIFSSGSTPWLVGGIVGVVIFLLATNLPVAFIDGFRLNFVSSTWTLTYRELRALNGITGEPAAEPEAPAEA